MNALLPKSFHRLHPCWYHQLFRPISALHFGGPCKTLPYAALYICELIRSVEVKRQAQVFHKLTFCWHPLRESADSLLGQIEVKMDFVCIDKWRCNPYNV